MGAKWDAMSQIREEVFFTKGRVIVRGKLSTRGEPKRADCVLSHKPGIPLAVIEAKDNNHSVGAGMQQALDYATTLDVPFAFSSNGDAFRFHDRTEQFKPVEVELSLDAFPSPEARWQRYCAWKGLTPRQEAIAAQGREASWVWTRTAENLIGPVDGGVREGILEGQSGIHAAILPGVTAS